MTVINSKIFPCTCFPLAGFVIRLFRTRSLCHTARFLPYLSFPASMTPSTLSGHIPSVWKVSGRPACSVVTLKITSLSCQIIGQQPQENFRILRDDVLNLTHSVLKHRDMLKRPVIQKGKKENSKYRAMP